MIRILWRSASCLAVLKPAGLATQAPRPHDSLETRLRVQISREPSGGQPLYVALPHRLDRAVSGVMLVALSKRTAGLLSQQFETRKVSKIYLAWVEGQVASQQAPWVDRLRKLPDQAKAEVVVQGTTQRDPLLSHADMPAGREAITEASVVRRQGEESLLELRPLTGRMHQLRIQSAHRGHPIIGDTLYGSSKSWPGDGETTCGDTIALHAWKIQFRDPRDGKAVTVEAPPCWAAERMP